MSLFDAIQAIEDKLRAPLARIVGIFNLTVRVIEELARPLIVTGDGIRSGVRSVLLDLPLVSYTTQRIKLEVAMLTAL